MKLSDYMKDLNELIKENPESLNMELITSIDDEGNGYNRVYYSPALVEYDGQDIDPLIGDKSTANAVCLN